MSDVGSQRPPAGLLEKTRNKHTHTHTRARAHTHTHTHARTHTHTHTHTPGRDGAHKGRLLITLSLPQASPQHGDPAETWPKGSQFECHTPSAAERPAPDCAETTFGRGLENHVSLGFSSSGPNNGKRSQGIYFRDDHSRQTRCPNLLAEDRQAPFGAKKRPQT